MLRAYKLLLWHITVIAGGGVVQYSLGERSIMNMNNIWLVVVRMQRGCGATGERSAEYVVN
jgi:hypothetical protein